MNNVIVTIEGTEKPDEIIEINAHYDTAGAIKGADDNGSGVISMLEMMHVFSKSKPKRTIRFVFTDLEERGMHGSDFHAKSIQDKSEKVLAVFVIDMIGYAQIGDGQEFHRPKFVVEAGTGSSLMHKNKETYFKSAAIAQLLHYQHYKYMDRRTDLQIEFDGAMPNTSDLGSYWKHKVPGVLLASIYEDAHVNPGYHKSNDTFHNYNLTFFEAVSYTHLTLPTKRIV